MLIVHAHPKADAIPEREEMPPGSTANIEHPHALGYHVLQELELRAKEGLDLGWLRGRIQSSIQQAGRIDVVIRHASSQVTASVCR